MADRFIIEGLAELRKLADGYAGAPKLIRDLIVKAGKKFAEQSRRTSVDEHLSNRSQETLGVYRGDLRSRLRADVSDDGDSVFAGLASSMPYARAWEYGRAPGRQPPSKPLAEWARLVLGVPEKESKGVGYLIARSIGQKGRKARPFMRPALEKNLDSLSNDITTLIQGAASAGWKYGV